MGKGKADIEGLSVSVGRFEHGVADCAWAGLIERGLDQAEHDGFFGRFLAIAD